MRALILPALFIAFAAAVAPAPVRPLRVTAVAPPPHEKADPTGDLKVVAELKSGKTIQAGTIPWIDLTLVNASKTLTYPVVKPGDGSEMGWRDPYIFFTGSQQGADGKWTAMRPSDYARCGLFDWNWPKDVIDLKPGEKLPLKDHHSGPLLEFQKPGKVRLIGHYAYRAAGGKRGEPRPEEFRGRMRGVPLFEVVSEPVEFEVVRPLDVRVKVKRPMIAGVEHRLSDILEVTVVNLTPNPVPVSDPTGYPGATLALELRAELGWGPHFDDYWARPGANCVGLAPQLPPNGSAALFGPDRIDGTWLYPRPEIVRVRAVFRPGVRDSHVAVLSEWVEVTVEK